MPITLLKPTHYKQETKYTCTPACIRMVLDLHGVKIMEGQLASLVGAIPGTKGGTLFKNIRNVEALGFNVTLQVGDVSHLISAINAGMPVITAVEAYHLGTHQGRSGPHSVLVVGVDEKMIYLFDPARDTAPDAIQAGLFGIAWSQRGNLMVRIEPK